MMLSGGVSCARRSGAHRIVRWTICGAGALALICAAADSHARRTRGSAGAAPAKPAPQHAEPYAAACLLEPTTGTFIFEKDAHKQWPTASLSKMMVTLIVAERLRERGLNLSDPVATSRKASKMGGSQVFLKEGETFTLEEMMKAMVVHSGNDATVAIAEHLAGSTAAFVRLMNRRAAELGMKDTRYHSVHGLPPAAGGEFDVSSAHDAALLAQELLKHPDVMRWSAIDTAPFRNGEFQIRNTNHLVRTYRGCDGLKTGYHARAGFNVVATAQRDGLRLVAVVLGTARKRDNFRQAAELLSEGFLNFEMRKVAARGTETARAVRVSGGTVAVLKPRYESDLAIFAARNGDARDFTLELDLPDAIAAPVRAGQRIGTAAIMIGGKRVASAPLVAPADIERAPSLMERLLGRL
jgi:D-alanyl-D-alanine carboxypeptidase (penicillin-binding protein 5/6)